MQEKYPNKDTYFFNKDIALKEAIKKHRVYTDSTEIDGLQICYYTADEPFPNAPSNCIFVPLENVYNYFATTKNRFPKIVNFDDTGYTVSEQIEVQEQFNAIMQTAILERKELEKIYMKEIRKFEPDFNDEKLRVFIPACRETTVMQYVSRNIADACEEAGYDVHFFIQDNDMQTCGDKLPLLVALHNCNPHILIGINHLNNNLINDTVFNFIWFQDPMPALYNKAPVNMRERDFIFTLFDEYKDALMKKGVLEDQLAHQSFATNPKLFYKNDSIKREDKIVFLGSDYNFEKDANIDDECIEALYEHIEKNELTLDLMKEYAVKYDVEVEYFKMYVVPSLVRRRVVIWLCALENIEIEVYGTDTWMKTPQVVPFYKGLLPYGNEMSKVYNSAKYSLAVHPQYRYQQRVIEMSASGTIPVIYDCDLVTEEFIHEDNVLSFSTADQLQECIGKTPKKCSSQIAEDISYKKMVEVITQKINNSLGKEK